MQITSLMQTNTIESIPDAALCSVTGGFSSTQVRQIESSAVRYATHELGGGPVFLGDVNNATHAKTFTNKGVLVSTGDEASSQFFTGRVLINKQGTPQSLKTL